MLSTIFSLIALVVAAIAFSWGVSHRRAEQSRLRQLSRGR